MSTMLDEDLLTVVEAASLLKVHTSTIRRWIAQGNLPAYRVGQRRVALKREDVANLIGLARPSPVQETGMLANDLPVIPPLTPDQRQQYLDALESSRLLRAELLEKRGGVLFPNSWELINEERDERSRERG